MQLETSGTALIGCSGPISARPRWPYRLQNTASRCWSALQPQELFADWMRDCLPGLDRIHADASAQMILNTVQAQTTSVRPLWWCGSRWRRDRVCHRPHLSRDTYRELSWFHSGCAVRRKRRTVTAEILTLRAVASRPAGGGKVTFADATSSKMHSAHYSVAPLTCTPGISLHTATFRHARSVPNISAPKQVACL
jgi:hypothetical protein